MQALHEYMNNIQFVLTEYCSDTEAIISGYA